MFRENVEEKSDRQTIRDQWPTCDRLGLSLAVVRLFILLLLSMPVDIASAQVPARVETPSTLIDAERRTMIQGGLETPLRGNGPLTGYAYLLLARPHFLHEDLYLA